MSRLGPGHGEGRDRVVVGDRDRREPDPCRATTTSQGEQVPSECVVWTCRSAPRVDMGAIPAPAGMNSGGISSGDTPGLLESISGGGMSSAGSGTRTSGSAAAGSGTVWEGQRDLRLQHPVEDAVDEPARLRGAIPLG